MLRSAAVVVVAVGAILASRSLLEATDPTTGRLLVTDATPGPPTPTTAEDPAAPSPAAVARATPPWTSIPAAPIAGREAHSMVWTGDEAIVWGGRAEAEPLADGAAYDPARRTWEPIPASARGRAAHTAVWTGEEMLVWGGDSMAGRAEEEVGWQFVERPRAGEAYDPETGQWRELRTAPLVGRTLHTAVWTGREMIVWGGTLDGEATDGAAYDPAADTWRLLATAPLPARAAHEAVWTGREMVVWGGIGIDGVPTADGAAYDPAADTWRPVDPAPLKGRTQHAMVWDGTRVLVWGGAGAAGTGTAYADGATWDPGTATWTPLPPVPLEGRFAPVAVWTGRRVVVWGGIDAQLFTDGASYFPEVGQWNVLPDAPVDSPSRYPVVWTGREMIVWAGRQEPSAAALDLPGG